jgi:hypothetical protein
LLKTPLALVAALVAAVIGVLVVHAAPSRPAARAGWTCPKTAALIALPAIGTVKWRSTSVAGLPRYSLGIHLFDTASTEVRFRTGTITRDRDLEPGDPTLWFRYSPNDVQWLAAVSGGEGGVVVGVVRADFRHAAVRHGRSQDCWMFYPPRVTVHFYGHQPSVPRAGYGGMLRHWWGLWPNA